MAPKAISDSRRSSGPSSWAKPGRAWPASLCVVQLFAMAPRGRNQRVDTSEAAAGLDGPNG